MGYPVKVKYRCAWCDAPFETLLAHAVHVSIACKEGPEPGDRAAVTREVHCPACAAPIDLRQTSDCPRCGRTYEGA